MGRLWSEAGEAEAFRSCINEREIAMKILRSLVLAASGAVLSLAAFAAEYPAPKEGTFIAKDFGMRSQREHFRFQEQ